MKYFNLTIKGLRLSTLYRLSNNKFVIQLFLNNIK